MARAGPFAGRSRGGPRPYAFRKYLLSARWKVDDIDPGDELLDVVDEQDRVVVGQAIRREVRRRRLLHRVLLGALPRPGRAAVRAPAHRR